MIAKFKYKITSAIFGLIALPIIVFSSCYLIMGRTPAMALLTHGGAMFLEVSPDSDRLSSSIRLALREGDHEATPGPFVWAEAAPGFETGNLPVLSNGRDVDHILLARVDPAKFRVVARNDPSATTFVTSWMKSLGANLVVNGSYYATSGFPDTPFVADGKPLGPVVYSAKQGALVASDTDVTIRDLSSVPWSDALAGARDAMVSYPLLLDTSGKAKPIKPSNWLANRTFVAMDGEGWVVFGTTKNAFFSLARFASFLEIAPLNLRATLNLDGGPVACQAIAIGTFKREFCGEYEIQADNGKIKKLSWLYGRWALPIALAVIPR